MALRGRAKISFGLSFEERKTERRGRKERRRGRVREEEEKRRREEEQKGMDSIMDFYDFWYGSLGFLV